MMMMDDADVLMKHYMQQVLPCRYSSSCSKGQKLTVRKIETTMNVPRLLSGTSRTALELCKESTRSFGSGGGTRGTRGHGWWINYRAGKGGRHLQGEYSHIDVEAQKAWNDAIFSLGSQLAYVDIQMEPLHQEAANEDGLTQHRLIVELATEAFPRATENFTKLLEAEQDGYKSTTLHRMEKKVGILGGHVWNGTGKCFEDFLSTTSATSMDQTEHMVLSHLPGVVTMLSQRVKEIDSRFMLCTHRAPHLDGKALAIGRLDDESLKLVQHWESTLITQKGHPSNIALRIKDCGIVEEDVKASA
jgi:cyclophilin family peptidyl-prolyl cis-trans isomerase